MSEKNPDPVEDRQADHGAGRGYDQVTTKIGYGPNSVTLRDNRTGAEAELPILSSSTGGFDVIDLGRLSGDFNRLKTLDPGYPHTASTVSNITYIDGEQGILQYRGYPIEQLAEQSTFMETAYLLREGELPTKDQLAVFEQEMADHADVPDEVVDVLYAMRNKHPMAMISAAVTALADEHPQSQVPPHHMIAKMPTIVANAFRISRGDDFMEPDKNRPYTERFLHMCFADDRGRYESNPVLTEAMDKIFILHADHEQNASTSTARTVVSTGADPVVAIASGINALWGPKHGGANQAVLLMLDEIGTVDRIPEFVARAKDKDDSFRLMGFGHRIYKNFDPRARIIKAHADEVLSSLHVQDEKLAIARELEQIALQDEYFIARKLYPNVDFYSGIILRAMNFPPNMFTPIFEQGRIAGQVAHMEEVVGKPDPITRPYQLYQGPKKRDFVPMERRDDEPGMTIVPDDHPELV
ncbi:MAG: citrate synthase [Alphaproteobacteria bacterium]|nr:citrate synthase [Alphaproteobacteria bacterium]